MRARDVEAVVRIIRLRELRRADVVWGPGGVRRLAASIAAEGLREGWLEPNEGPEAERPRCTGRLRISPGETRACDWPLPCPVHGLRPGEGHAPPAPASTAPGRNRAVRCRDCGGPFVTAEDEVGCCPRCGGAAMLAEVGAAPDGAGPPAPAPCAECAELRARAEEAEADAGKARDEAVLLAGVRAADLARERREGAREALEEIRFKFCTEADGITVPVGWGAAEAMAKRDGLWRAEALVQLAMEDLDAPEGGEDGR